jgi:hypothetical protein
MTPHFSKLRSFIAWTVAVVILGSASVRAATPSLNVQLIGNGKLAFTVSPVRPEGVYDILARTNDSEGHWIRLTQVLGGSNISAAVIYEFPKTPGPGLCGLTDATLQHWTFVAGYGDDSDGDGLPDVFEDLVSRTDPVLGEADDGYGDPDGDGWLNLQELANDTDPLRADRPPGPRLSVSFFSNTNSARLGKAVLKIQCQSGALPDFFEIEKSERTLRPPAERGRNGRTVSQPGTVGPSTNRLARLPRPIPGRHPFQSGEDPLVTGPAKMVGRVMTRPGVSEYTFEETNVDTLFQPLYSVRAHFVPPYRAFLNRTDTVSIRQSVLSVNVNQSTNGYDLVALHPIPYGRYLLLVRDKLHSVWRASGYFEAGTNREPVRLHVNAQGMMDGNQRPIALSKTRFTPAVSEPEFTAGWAEDGDGDGLPDIYEVLVTETDPMATDTGNSGILDGYKDPDRDGWSNLEEFRRRTDPKEAAIPPQPITLLHPTLMELARVLPLQSDLPYETRVLIRTNAAARFEPLNQPIQLLYYSANPTDRRDARGNFDLIVTRRVPEGPITRPSFQP